MLCCACYAAQVPEAVQGALKAVVLDSSHRRAKSLMARLLSAEAGLQEVYRQVQRSAVCTGPFSSALLFSVS